MPKRNAIVQPLLLAVILASGFAIVWSTLVVWVSEMVRD